jgi:two-component system sporulation sensor kinase B
MIFDMRYVIMFFAVVYGGIPTALILLVEFIIYRFYLGGEGTWAAILILFLTFSIAVIFCKISKKIQSTEFTFLAGIVFSIVPSFLIYLYFPNYVAQHLVFHILVVPIQNSIGIWLLMFLFRKAVADKNMFIKQAQNERTQAISQVAASLAHEVRNPLTVVKGFQRLITENLQEPDKIKLYAEISLEEIQRTEHIISEYLSISKPPTLRTEAINLSEQLHIIYDLMTPYASLHNVDFKIHTPDSSLIVMGNASEIKQVFVNFIKNAVEACVQQTNGRVTIKLMAIGNNATITVNDNGIGMSEDQSSRLGSVYYSTKTNGTGLGLAYSYHVIHALGGIITVSSKINNGTKFTVKLPLLDGQ